MGPLPSGAFEEGGVPRLLNREGQPAQGNAGDKIRVQQQAAAKANPRRKGRGAIDPPQGVDGVLPRYRVALPGQQLLLRLLRNRPHIPIGVKDFLRVGFIVVFVQLFVDCFHVGASVYEV